MNCSLQSPLSSLQSPPPPQLMHDCGERICSFGAGPSKMPTAVLQSLASRICPSSPQELSILEQSHRSPQFAAVLEECRSSLRLLLAVPPDYEIGFMAGGATLLFSALPLAFSSELCTPKAAYICSGLWSTKAQQEAHDLGVQVHSISSNEIDTVATLCPSECAYLWMCVNETVNGVEFQSPELESILSSVPSGIPVICDASSSLLSRAFPVHKFGVVFGGVQKNIGPAGVALVIVQKALLAQWSCTPRPTKKIPSMLDLVKCFKHNSLLNTPPTFSIYGVQEQLKWLIQEFGGSIEAIEASNKRKAEGLYAVIDGSGGFYRGAEAVEVKRRSRMNVVWGLGDVGLEKVFLEEAGAQGLVQLAGHRDVGGLRASLYNAVREWDVERLVRFMRSFQAKWERGRE